MIGASNMAEVAALVGNPARASMLSALTDGRALTASELAFVAGVTGSTASAHLGKLAEEKLVVVAKQGRHRYYRLASPLVARMLEGIMAVASIQAPPRHRPRSPRDEALRLARTCYDHLAGRLGVAIADSLAERDCVILAEDGGEVTATGEAFLREFGIDLVAPRRHQRIFCRPCLDWSERRPHLAGAIGAALACRCLDLGWIARVRDSRAVTISARGREGFRATFGFELA